MTIQAQRLTYTMNPFKTKTLEQFTIDDCEQYIKNFPYGERIQEVKKQLNTLKRLAAEAEKDDTAMKARTTHRQRDPLDNREQNSTRGTSINTSDLFRNHQSVSRDDDSKSQTSNNLMTIIVIVAAVPIFIGIIALFIYAPAVMFPVGCAIGMITAVVKSFKKH